MLMVREGQKLYTERDNKKNLSTTHHSLNYDTRLLLVHVFMHVLGEQSINIHKVVVTAMTSLMGNKLGANGSSCVSCLTLE